MMTDDTISAPTEDEEMEVRENLENQDPASRLLALIERIESTTRYPKANTNTKLASLPLHESLDSVAHRVKMKNSLELLTKFLKLCEETKREIEQLELKRESVRENWFIQIDNISSTFDASNFGRVTSTVFSEHLSPTNKAALDIIAERFLINRTKHSSKVELKESLSTIRETVDAFNDSGKVTSQFSRLMKQYVNHLEQVIQNYDDLGEDNFWETYKILFATFMQLHDDVVDEGNKTKITKKMKASLNKLILATSLGANAVTIGTAAVPLLT